MKRKNNPKLLPVDSYATPAYPDRWQVETDPSLLLKHVPLTWLKKPLASGILMVIAAGGYITADDVDRLLPIERETAAQGDTSKQEHRVEKKKNTGIIAPLFIFGSGSGATGCVVMSPPTFIPEHEAVEIISNELKKAGLTFEHKEYVLTGMTTKKRWINWSDDFKTRTFKDFEDENPFYFELFNKELNLGIKYLTRSNYRKLGGLSDTSSVQGYDLVEIAQEIREKLRDFNKTGKKINAVFFYDPMNTSDRHPFFGTGPDKGRQKSVSDLRNQVNAFVEWFKKEKMAEVLQNENR